MKFKGEKVKPHQYLAILEEAFVKACLLEKKDLAQKFAERIEKNKKHGNSSLEEIKEAIFFLSED